MSIPALPDYIILTCSLIGKTISQYSYCCGADTPLDVEHDIDTNLRNEQKNAPQHYNMQNIVHYNEQMDQNNAPQPQNTKLTLSRKSVDNNLYHNLRHIDVWTCRELQEWIRSLNVNSKQREKVIQSIAEQECTGTEFNSMEDISEVIDSFEIDQITATKIFAALQMVRKNAKQSGDANVEKNPENSGIIGLNNLKNTCFINSVIQGLLQTPGLTQYLRGFTGDANAISATMLDAFIEVTAAAMQRDAKYNSIAPKSIVKHLRSSDVKFAYGEQGDALSAVSKMIELLDKGIIAREKKKGRKKDAKKHTGSWHIEVTEDNDEEEILEGNLLFYNPYDSVIREYIHFVERNLFTCMKCGWQEARYDIKEKVLLPLKDHNTTIFVDIYIPSIKGDGAVFAKQECVILDYCPIQTLKYQILQKILTNKKVKFKLKNVGQISIGTVKADKNKLLTEWIEHCDAKQDCSVLTTQTNKYIFAVFDVNKKHQTSIAVTTFHVRLDQNGNADPNESYLEFDKMKKGETKSFSKTYANYPKKTMKILFNKQIFNADYECTISETNAVIVVIWAQQTMVAYQSLVTDQKDAIQRVFDAFADKQSSMKTKNEFIRDIDGGFETYCSTKVMDRGAVLKCGGRCKKKCDVFKQETKIVRFPEVLIFAIDRYINDQKFTKVVGYQEYETFDGNKYELYAVCNHSGGLGYGHYWAFVKGIDDNIWYNADDARINKMDVNRVMGQATAILLFYKRSK